MNPNDLNGIDIDSWGRPPKKTPKKTPPKRRGSGGGIHLENIIVTDADLWAMIKTRPGALKNWLTRNHPKSDVCQRSSALAEITNVVNLVLFSKLQEELKKRK